MKNDQPTPMVLMLIKILWIKLKAITLDCIIMYAED